MHIMQSVIGCQLEQRIAISHPLATCTAGCMTALISGAMASMLPYTGHAHTNVKLIEEKMPSNNTCGG